MLYDWLLTVADEIEVIWQRRMCFSTFILFANRAALFFYLSNLAANYMSEAVRRYHAVISCVCADAVFTRRGARLCRLPIKTC